MASLPSTWAELIDRMARLVALPDDEGRAGVEAWLRQAVHATWGVESLRDLERPDRQLAFQKASGVLLALHDEPGDLVFYTGLRQLVQDAFARYFHGAALDGPAWRLGPNEMDRPTYAAYTSAADFEGG